MEVAAGGRKFDGGGEEEEEETENGSKAANARERLTSNIAQGRLKNSYLPDGGLHRDHADGGPKARPCHCTSAWLTLAITPNAGNSAVQFLLVGTAFALSLDLSCYQLNIFVLDQKKNVTR